MSDTRRTKWVLGLTTFSAVVAVLAASGVALVTFLRLVGMD